MLMVLIPVQHFEKLINRGFYKLVDCGWLQAKSGLMA